MPYLLGDWVISTVVFNDNVYVNIFCYYEMEKKKIDLKNCAFFDTGG